MSRADRDRERVFLRDYVDRRFQDKAELYDERERVHTVESAAMNTKIDDLRKSRDEGVGRLTVITTLVATLVSIITGSIAGILTAVLSQRTPHP